MIEMEKEKSDQQAVLRQEPPTTENLETRHQGRCMGGEENAHQKTSKREAVEEIWPTQSYKTTKIDSMFANILQQMETSMRIETDM